MHKEDPFAQLTPREQQVLLALMRGTSALEISKESYVSLPTVRSQIRSILLKLHVSSQLAAVALAYRSGWPAKATAAARAPAIEGDRLAVGL